MFLLEGTFIKCLRLYNGQKSFKLLSTLKFPIKNILSYIIIRIPKFLIVKLRYCEIKLL